MNPNFYFLSVAVASVALLACGCAGEKPATNSIVINLPPVGAA